MVDWLGEAKLSRVGLLLLGAGVLGMPLARNLWMLAIAVALIPLGTAFTFPCVTALLSRVISPRERGLYMGMQQTYGGVARIVAPLFFGWSFDTLGVSSPYFFASAFIVATLLLSPQVKLVAQQTATTTPQPPETPQPVTSRSPQVNRLSSPYYADQERE